MTSRFEVTKQLVEVITIAHTAMVPPEVLGFTLHDADQVLQVAWRLRIMDRKATSSVQWLIISFTIKSA